MGLLDDLTYDPQMALGMGLLSAGGNSRMPVSFGQGLGSAWGNMQDTARAGQKAKIAEQQMQMQQSGLQEMQRKRKALDAFKAQLPPELQTQFDIDPQAFIKALSQQQEEYTLTPGAARFKGNQKLAEVPMKPNEAPLPWYVKQGPQGMQIDPAYADLERTKASFGRPPAQPMAPVAYVDDKGQTVWGTINEAKGRPAANYNPTVQGAVAGAKAGASTRAESEAKRDITMSGVTDLIGEARSLLKSGPTASPVGVGIDSVLGLVGASTKGADTAAKLKAIGGHLVAKQPRMEGPQSNFDVQNYKEMAGDVGNAMLPIGRRLAALAAVEKIITKYDKQAKPAAKSGASGEWSDL